MNRITIIGVDCAVDRKKVGLAVGVIGGGRVKLLHPQSGQTKEWSGTGAAEIVKCMEGDDPVLLAFDAPLGWPSALATTLIDHHAGDGIAAVGNDLFCRATDRRVKARFGFRPLDVGADKIARTALAALSLLDEIRRITGLAIPLGWNPSDLGRAQIIEAYPAATLRSHGLPFRKYKGGSKSVTVRRKIIQGLRTRIELPELSAILEQDDHLLDAVVCVLAGADFLRGEAAGPDEDECERAKKEGWIWIREAQ